MDTDNLGLYNKVRTVPEEAKKTIKGGRTSGFTDINPMWRIKTLTEHFGMAGIGWYYDIKKMWVEQGSNEEIAAFVVIDLFVNVNGEWSKPITGTGGSAFVSKESKGLYTSDECYKMALTDAISVACKALGIGADVYFAQDKTKYNNSETKGDANKYVCVDCGKPFEDIVDKNGKVMSAVQVYKAAQTKNKDLDGKARCKDCREKMNPAANG